MDVTGDCEFAYTSRSIENEFTTLVGVTELRDVRFSEQLFEGDGDIGGVCIRPTGV